MSPHRNEPRTDRLPECRKQDVDDLNCLIGFLAKRDLAELTSDALFARHGVRQVDRLILMGGITTPDFVELAAHAVHGGFARGLMVIGGMGHSTQNLRDNIAKHPRYGIVPTTGRPEADMLCDILIGFLAVARDAIVVERASTNCGTNAAFALQATRQSGVIPRLAVIVQDPIMQRRTCESFLHAWQGEPTVFDCFAPAIPLLGVREGLLAFLEPAHAPYYNMHGFLDLVMGEIPRLRDDAKGYGPRGHGFIGHVDIPDAVGSAFARLEQNYSRHIRPGYASEK